MTEVVSVRFNNAGKSYYFAPNGTSIKAGEPVIVETAKGIEFAFCSVGNHYVGDEKVVAPLRAVLRKASNYDIKVYELCKANEPEAMEICKAKAKEHGLDMKVIGCEYGFDGNKVTFFFTSDGRVDFRELVKDLASVFRMRIELRQVGVRDEAKMLGGIGMCGRQYCCNLFLDEFSTVSTKMAKHQSLSLNPTKISGACGRLMCCLRYEEEAYEELISKSPKVGSSVITAYGTGTVVSNNLLRQTVKIKMDDDRDEAFRTLKITELGEEAVKAAQFAKKIQEEKAQRTFEQYTFENTETNEIDTPLNFNEDDNGDAGSKERRDKEHGTRSRQTSPNRGKKSDFTKKKNYPRKKNTFKNKSGQGSVPDKIEGNTVREKSGDKQSAGGRKKKNFKGSYHKNRKNDKAKPSF